MKLGVSWDIDLDNEGSIVRNGEEESEEVGGKRACEGILRSYGDKHIAD